MYKQIVKHIWNKVVKKTYSDLVVYNELGHKVPHLEYERDEQLLVSHYIKENDVVLELGARYGSVSCIINKILKNKKNQVSVEPDNTVWEALERTKRENKCDFLIYKGIVSSNKYDLKLNGYGSTVDITNTISNMQTISSANMSLADLQSTTGLKFNVLVADCEGFLETFLEENKFLYKQLDLILFECDRSDVCDYAKIKSNLLENNFRVAENGFQCAFKKMH
jgi:FkbM family methyltransferase